MVATMNDKEKILMLREALARMLVALYMEIDDGMRPYTADTKESIHSAWYTLRATDTERNP